MVCKCGHTETDHDTIGCLIQIAYDYLPHYVQSDIIDDKIFCECTCFEEVKE